MIRYGITRFVGSWFGHRLIEKRIRPGSAAVDFVDPSGKPVARSYMADAPSVRMLTHFDDPNGAFEVDLREKGKGFTLHPTHECH